MKARWASLPLPLLGQARFGISRALMRCVRAPLTMEVDRRIARIVWWRLIHGRLVFGPKALEAGRRFDQCAVDREVVVTQQSQASCLAHHLVEELLGNVMLEQPLAVLGEHGRIEARLHQVHIQKPAIQEVVVQLLTEGPLAAHRVQRDQQRRLEQPLGRNRWSPTRRVHLIEDWRHLCQRTIGELLDHPQWMRARYALLQIHERQHRCLRLVAVRASPPPLSKVALPYPPTPLAGRAKTHRSGRIFRGLLGPDRTCARRSMPRPSRLSACTSDSIMCI